MGIADHKVSIAGGGIVPMSWYVAQLGLNLLWQALFFKNMMLRMASKEVVLLLGDTGGMCVAVFQGECDGWEADGSLFGVYSVCCCFELGHSK